ncbi:gamma-type small acid-soluble spore protein [Bacillus thuringiensis]|uniref:Small, acid-soluble spore protein gamma-type n=1 Tax=Bacillus thuringiensis TaxID=1428 RepID=A0A9W3TD52_BACTU|nr:gamma-type small acid-soluble spore protein [Bacillus thuringiensis]AQY39112.1 gamma-type small acid-soluble spore protein [Bacillus thuringiensis]MDR4150831.1 gamma-type small acid-soluble spore protein [Bacillus thuringiensis]MEC3573782.1 gamma-type small acid-soluble spore protein [Bacillus thuringiensis]MED2143668.1 gamma-type small acid-soluble spore protein [Bacillus thuringiensis]MED2521000.1 gamma-type small acid-soluble spore protein [Bacillus thuringiensis]
MNKNQQGYNKTNLGTGIQSTNGDYGTEFSTETNVNQVKQQNAQSEAKKSQVTSAGIQSANAGYGTEFSTETNVNQVKQQNAQSAAKKSQGLNQ